MSTSVCLLLCALTILQPAAATQFKAADRVAIPAIPSAPRSAIATAPNVGVTARPAGETPAPTAAALLTSVGVQAQKGAGEATQALGHGLENGRPNAASETQDMLAGDEKAEIVMPGFFWGSLNLKQIARAKTPLPADRRAWLDAYKTIVERALRPVGSRAPAALDARDAMHRQVLADIGLTPEAFAAMEAHPVVDAVRTDRENDISAEMLTRATQLGLHRLKFPAEHGGLELHQREYVEALEVVSRVSPSLVGQMSAHNTIGTAPLTMFGTPEQQSRYLPELTKGDGLVSFGLTEPEAGTDLKRLQTAAVLSEDGKSWKITGTKIFITGITDARRMYVVAGHTIVDGKDIGPTVFLTEDLGFRVNQSWDDKRKNLLDLADRGLTITPWTRDGFEMMMIKGTDQGFIQMKDFEVPVGNVLGPLGRDAATGLDGKKVPLLSLTKGRAGFAYLNAGARQLSDRQTQWAVDRLMFDMYSPSKDEPGRQGYMTFPAQLLGRSRMKAAALKVLGARASALLDAHPDAGAAALSALIKVRMSDWVWQNGLDTLELAGGHGLIKGAPGRVYQTVLDLWISRIVEGNNPAMSQFALMIAGGKAMAELGTPLGMLKFAWNQAVNAALPWIVTSQGALTFKDAKWVQQRTAEWSRRFNLTAMSLGWSGFKEHVRKTGKWTKLLNPLSIVAGVMKASQIAMAARQDLLLRAFEAQADILTVSFIQTELAQNGAALDAEERWALDAALSVLKISVEQGLAKLNPVGDAVTNIEIALGRKLVEAELARVKANPEARPNRVEEHLEFLRSFAADFHARLRREAGR